MKNNFIKIAGVLMLFSVLQSCKKDDGVTKKDILQLIDEVPAITTTKNATGSQSISVTNAATLAAFLGKFDVALYFPGAEPPAKVDIVVRKNNSTSNVKVFKANVTTFPSSYTITAAELLTLFGTQVVLGDRYDFSVDIYLKNGTKYEAFPVGGVGTAGGPLNYPNFSELARFEAICAYDPAIYEGNFIVQEDAWQDWFPGDIVTFTRVSNNSFSFIDPFARGPLIPVIVTVNTASNAVTIDRQVVGTSWAWAAPSAWPNPTVSGTGSVAPCDRTITLAMQYGFGGVNGGTFSGGPYALRLIKQ